MDSRLPKPNFQFKVPARIPNGPSTFETLKPSTIKSSTETVVLPKTQQATSKTVSSAVASSKKTDENKAPSTRAKTLISRTNPVITRGTQKRPGLVNSMIEPKRANLATSMKPVARPIRPNTTVGPLGRSGQTAAVVTTKAAGAKPSKWDIKGRLEYTSNELTALKQKHREITSQYNSIQEEIVSLRESESSCRLRAEQLEKDSSQYTTQIEDLKTKILALEKERDQLTNEFQASKKLCEKQAASLEEYKKDATMKATLITEQNSEILELKSTLESRTKEKNDLQTLVQDLDRERRYLHNFIQEMKGNIRVFCRIRPRLPKESSKNLSIINYLDECTLEIGKADDISSNTKLKGQRQEFSFDKVFPPNASQAAIFEELSMLVQSALEGYNVCVFAYGQTGSGKTYTMEGFPGTDDEGMIPRTVKHIFTEMKHFELLGWEYKIEASFLEIYNEQIVDLLDNSKKSHDIRMADSKGSDLYVTNLLVQEIHSPEELNQCLLIARENRAMAATQSNERSSRSHSVARIRLIGTHKANSEICVGNLNLVDLAGSERLKNEEAARIAETKNINKSLANLGHVILALLQKQDHIPYRNSKLTHLLMPSLGGNSKTLMLLNISPLDEAFNESVNSLRFGSNVNNCKMGTAKKVKTVL
ncbi:hypothetical protein QAD02_010668 [Eretmocerus hayati]|uniref:Uncharacterized protein n=1 Tax=Eretmocerus hayati TaxID=131215 RepID=A0ACC2NUW9_9HYME|nr:hypothetical protein QAD02_010668 [Eretmocerus hayati]